MPIKFKAKSKEEIPAELQSLYVEREGAFVLDVEGAVDRAMVDGFRDSNVALTRERDDLKRRFERSESEQVKAIAAERDTLNARLTAIQVDQGVTTVATKKGLRPSAIPDITARARSVFKLAQGTHSVIPFGFSAAQFGRCRFRAAWWRGAETKRGDIRGVVCYKQETPRGVGRKREYSDVEHYGA